MHVDKPNKLWSSEIKDLFVSNAISETVTGSVFVSENHFQIQAKFQAKNIQNFKTTYIQASDLDFEASHFYATFDNPDSHFKKNFMQNEFHSSQNHNSKALRESKSKFLDLNELSLIRDNFALQADVKSVINLDYITSGAHTAQAEEFVLSKDKHVYKSFSYYAIEKFLLDNPDIQNLLGVKNDDTFMRLLGKLSSSVDLDVNLTSDMAEIVHNLRYAKIPFLKKSPVISLESIQPNIESLLLSRIYSVDHQKSTKIINQVVNKLNDSVYIGDILTIITLEIARGADYPTFNQTFFIPLSSFLTKPIDNDDELITPPTQDTNIIKVTRHDPLVIIDAEDPAAYFQEIDAVEIGGVYDFRYNVAFYKSNPSYFMHEVAHAVMYALFDNDGNPYYAGSADVHDRFEKAKFDMFVKVAGKIGLSVPEELTSNKQIINLLNNFKNHSLEELGLRPSELELIAEIQKVMYGYPEDKLDKELIVLLPQLAMQGIDNEAMNYYFAEFNNFWNDFVHPYAAKLIEAHKEACQHNNINSDLFSTENAMTFDFCLPEFDY